MRCLPPGSLLNLLLQRGWVVGPHPWQACAPGGQPWGRNRIAALGKHKKEPVGLLSSPGPQCPDHWDAGWVSFIQIISSLFKSKNKGSHKKGALGKFYVKALDLWPLAVRAMIQNQPVVV